MDHPPTIIWLVEQAVREWVLGVTCSEARDPQDRVPAPSFSVFYVDRRQPNQIQPTGAAEDRCRLWIEPNDVCSETGLAALLVDVKIAHRIDGRPTVTEFQVSLTEDLRVLVH
jgi:hypothetical protein